MTYRKFLNVLIYSLILVFPFRAVAGNIDPDNDGSRYGYAENAGWINFAPSSGPGVTVTASNLTGYAWGENIGWINLSPTGSGVVNDGNGHLSGYAWGGNIGWINFAPTGGGVYINACGDFNGTAWGENIGWINFGSDSTSLFRVTTSWVSPLDAIAPFTTITSTPQAWYKTDASISFSATDCGAGVKEVHYRINSSSEVVVHGSTATATVTAEGCNALNYYSVDNADNTEAAQSTNICIDKTSPAITITTPPDGATYS